MMVSPIGARLNVALLAQVVEQGPVDNFARATWPVYRHTSPEYRPTKGGEDALLLPKRRSSHPPTAEIHSGSHSDSSRMAVMFDRGNSVDKRLVVSELLVLIEHVVGFKYVEQISRKMGENA